MTSNNITAGIPWVVLAAALLLAPMAGAFDVSVSGFIRQEMAYKLNGDENRFNRTGTPLNGKTFIADGAFSSGVLGVPYAGLPYQKEDKSGNNNWNLFATKAELDFQFRFTNSISGFMKIRGYYQPDVFDDWKGYDRNDHPYDFSPTVEGIRDTDEFGVNNHGNEATYLSFSDNDYMIDVPAMYLDWVSGPWWVRVGQQQIAWGEGLFFRVADQPNGLDVRRHFFLDYGSEEYADERLSAPGIRASYNLSSDWELEVYAQMFQPSVLMAQGSSYNLIAQPNFTINYQDGFDRVEDQINAGVRLLGQIGDLGLQFFAISQHNPNPAFDLQAGGQKIFTDEQCANPAALGLLGGLCGFEQQPFIFVNGGDGTTSAYEWFWLSGQSGIDGVGVLNGLVEEWPWITEFVQGLGVDTTQDAMTTVRGGGPNDFFGLIPGGFNGYDFVELFPTFAQFVGFDSLTGVIKANYESENIFGAGFNYIFYAEPDTWLDQLIMRAEVSYTPNKSFTNALRSRFIEEDEILATFVLEKYHRFSDEFPATYLVFEWHWREESDLLGRHLSGLGGNAHKRPGGGEDSRGWNGWVLAFSQPSPALKWRFDLATLYDEHNGFLIQPGVKWKPTGNFTVEAFINFIDGNGTDSIFNPFDQTDDLTFRIGYQF